MPGNYTHFPEALNVLEKGLNYYNTNQFERAKKEFKKAIAIDPQFSLAYCKLGMTYYSEGYVDSAKKEFENALKKNKKLAEGYYGLGLVYSKIKNSKRLALEHFTKALRINPEFEDARYHLGLLYLSLKEMELAQREFNKVIDLAPMHRDAYYELGYIFQHKGSLDQAIALYQKQLQINPSHYDAYYRMAFCFFQKKDYQNCIELLRRLLVLNSEYYKAHLLMGYIFSIENRHQEAFDYFKSALKLLSNEEREHYLDVKYLLPADEQKKYQQLTSEQKEEFIRLFWKQRDPDPTSEVNERLVEHYRRVFYSRENFSQGNYPWDRRGEIYIRYGEPDERQHFIKSLPEKWGVYTQDADYDSRQPSMDAKIEQIQDFSQYKINPEWGRHFGPRAAECWIYADLGIEFYFTDEFNNGNFDFPWPITPRQFSISGEPVETAIGPIAQSFQYSPTMVAANVVAHTPEIYHYEYGGEPLNVIIDIADFRGENDHTLLEIYYALPLWEISLEREGDRLKAVTETHIVLFDREWHEAAKMEANVNYHFATDQGTLMENFLVESEQLSLNGGHYCLTMKVRDKTSKKIALLKKEIDIESYSSNQLAISDIQLANNIQITNAPDRSVKNGLRVVPNPMKVYKKFQPIYIYYEIYNLTYDEQGKTHYQIDYALTPKSIETNQLTKLILKLGKSFGLLNHKWTITSSFEKYGTNRTEVEYLSFDVSQFPSGSYEIMVMIVDLNAGESISKNNTLKIIG